MKVAYEDHYGSDLKVVNMARVSFRKRKEALDDADKRLINYLASHKHWTPFSHCGATLHISAPIAIARQLFKHKIGFTESEVSRRYVDDAPIVHVPRLWRYKAKDKKQGSETLGVFGGEIEKRALAVVAAATEFYLYAIKNNICPEQARLMLPQGTYTEWYWTGSLPAWARMYGLRNAPDAQQETQVIAKQVGEIMKQHFPVSWEALTNGP